MPSPRDIVGLLQGSKRALPRKLRKKSEKGFVGPLSPGVKKARQKRVENESKTRKNLKNSHFRLFFEFLRPWAKRLREPFFRLFRSFLGRGLFDPCRRPMMSQLSPQKKITYTEEVVEELIGWHVCRTKLARKIFSGHKISHEKCSEIFPESFEPLIGPLFCGQENYFNREIPAKLPARFPSQKSTKKSPTSFCRTQGEELNFRNITYR